MSRLSSIPILVLGMLLSLCSLAVFATEAVLYRDGELSVSLEQVPLQQLATWIQQETDVEVVVAPALLQSTVTREFTEKPLEQGLGLLFERFGRALTYEREQGKLKVASVRIFSKGEQHIPDYQPLQQGTAVDDIAQLDLTHSEVVIQRNSQGAFSTDGEINHNPARFLVDTGATSIVLSGEFAAYLGLPFGVAQEVVTAGGTVSGYLTQLDQIAVGTIELHNLQGIVLPQMRGRTVLLGMNFLQHIELEQLGGRLHLRAR